MARFASFWVESDPARRAARHSLAIWPLIGIGFMVLVAHRADALGVDFTHAYLPAAHAVLAGDSPYPSATSAALATKTAFAYPPLTAYLVAPFTLFPAGAVGLVSVILALGCILAALRVMEVRDWRCYSIVLLWLPTYSAAQTANVTALVVLCLALLWRYRDRAIAPLLVGLLLALKLFLWPVVLWLLVTRRYRAGVGGVLASLVLILGPWAAIHFAGLRDFPHLLETLSRVQQLDGYTVSALLSAAMDWNVAHGVGLGVGFAVLGAALVVGRDDERRSFGFVVAASLLLSPIVHMHYLILLLVVLALFVPHLDWRWVVPVFLWLSPHVWGAAPWQKAVVLAVAGATVALAVTYRSPTQQSALSQLRSRESPA
jgi:alpha-1,2-mannosyltransferase